MCGCRRGRRRTKGGRSWCGFMVSCRSFPQLKGIRDAEEDGMRRSNWCLVESKENAAGVRMALTQSENWVAPPSQAPLGSWSRFPTFAQRLSSGWSCNLTLHEKPAQRQCIVPELTEKTPARRTLTRRQSMRRLSFRPNGANQHPRSRPGMHLYRRRIPRWRVRISRQ